MKKFKVYNMDDYFEDGTVVSEKKLRKTLHNWVETDWDGTVESFTSAFSKFGDAAWKIVRVKRRFEIVDVGNGWYLNFIKIGSEFSKKELLSYFDRTLKGWNGSLHDLNENLKAEYGIERKRIVFKESYIEVKDK